MLKRTGECHLRRVGARLQVVAPYNVRFIAFAHAQGARWRRRSGVWSFRALDRPAVLQAIADIFGAQAIHEGELDTCYGIGAKRERS